MTRRHIDEIRDQFTRQAEPFSASPQIRDEAFLARIVEAARTGPTDLVLDVACGPGLLACAFARVARGVIGVDITPDMLAQARALQEARALTNVGWHQGEAERLPYRDASFSIVSSRFAFHHILDPGVVLAEMRRVCKPGGRVVVVDTAPAPEKADAFNQMERLRDPSHVRSLPPAELLALFPAVGLPAPAATYHAVRYELEPLLARSFPRPGDADRIRSLFRASLETDQLGVNAADEDGRIVFDFPVLTLVATIAP